MNNKNKFLEMTQNIFLRISEELKESMIAARVIEMEEGVESPVLTAVYDNMGADGDEIIADYTVILVENEENTSAYIESFLAFTEELNKEHLPLVYEAISKLNFYLPYGSFAVDEDENVLGYKFGMPISTKLSEDALYESISFCMTGGYILANNYIFPLMQISEGNMSLDEVLELVRGVQKNK